MKYFITFFLFFNTFATSCSADFNYLKDRYKDVLDIFTISTGVGFGAKARVSAITPGLFINQDYIGLRSGCFFKMKKIFNERSFDISDPYYSIDLATPFPVFFLATGAEVFFVEPQYLERHKNIDTFHVFIVSVPRQINNFNDGWIKKIQNVSYFTQVEAAIGLGVSLRIGFNIGELVDFFGGLLTIDIYGDDYYSRPPSPGDPRFRY